MLQLVTYVTRTPFGAVQRLGSLLAGGDVVDLRASYERVLLAAGDAQAAAIAAVRIPETMLAFIRGGAACIAAADAALAAADHVVVAAALIHLAPPLVPGKIICMGRNYWEHAAESEQPVPDDFPRGFIKVASTLAAAGAEIPYPWATEKFDYESELAIVIGKHGHDIAPGDAYDYVFGYTILNDLSARDWQYAERSKGNHLLGKNLDGTGPLGPAIVLRRDVPDPMNLRVTQRVNGELRQDGRTRQMIHNIPRTIAHWSRMTLEPGDVISTGTPEGVAGLSTQPALAYLKPGDVIEAEVEGIGVLRNTIGAPVRAMAGVTV
jgi:acylpyruvate hydrolase